MSNTCWTLTYGSSNEVFVLPSHYILRLFCFQRFQEILVDYHNVNTHALFDHFLTVPICVCFMFNQEMTHFTNNSLY